MDVAQEPYSREAMNGFVSTVLKNVEERYIQQHSGTHLIGQLRDSLRFLQERQSGETKVRAFKPDSSVQGYELSGMVVETLLPDQPFVYDTIRLFLNGKNIRIRNSMNVVFSVERNEKGGVIGIFGGVDPQGSTLESYCRFYTDGVGDEEIESIRAAVEESLLLAQSMVRDFDRMMKVVMDL
jgi:NAD-specific glutamate dehydrogenase